MDFDYKKVFTLLDASRYREAEKYIDSYKFDDIDPSNKYNYLNASGYLYCELKKFEKAKLTYKKYLKLAQTENNPEAEHIAYHQLAMVERLEGNLKKAYYYITEESNIINKYFNDNNLKHAVNLYEKGYIKLQQDDIKNAQALMEKSLKYALKTSDDVAKACAYRGLGEVFKKEDKTTSNGYFDKAHKLFLKVGDEKAANEVQKLKKS